MSGLAKLRNHLFCWTLETRALLTRSKIHIRIRHSLPTQLPKRRGERRNGCISAALLLLQAAQNPPSWLPTSWRRLNLTYGTDFVVVWMILPSAPKTLEQSLDLRFLEKTSQYMDRPQTGPLITLVWNWQVTKITWRIITNTGYRLIRGWNSPGQPAVKWDILAFINLIPALRVMRSALSMTAH